MKASTAPTLEDIREASYIVLGLTGDQSSRRDMLDLASKRSATTGLLVVAENAGETNGVNIDQGATVRAHGSVGVHDILTKMLWLLFVEVPADAASYALEFEKSQVAAAKAAKNASANLCPSEGSCEACW